jgi:hypothetical protein
MRFRGATIIAALLTAVAAPASGAVASTDKRIPLPRLKLVSQVTMPGSPQAEERVDLGLLEGPAPPFVDSNSPAYWVGSSFVLVHSAGVPVLSTGSSVESLDATGRPFFASATEIDPELIDSDITVGPKRIRGGFWIEAVHRADDGTLYGFYHYETTAPLCPGTELTAPFIGVASSLNDGRSWRDLGLVLAAPTNTIDCSTPNEYFAGGVGDFTVLERKGFLYFLFSSYPAPIDQQGVGVARFAVEHLNDPVGHVSKWFDGRFTEPGLGGQLTPILPVDASWHSASPDAFWGPSVHWNTYLRRYVMLLNRAEDAEWAQDGVYVSFNRDISDPEGWSHPRRILETDAFYPQVIGTDLPGEGTDRRAGKRARLFVHGVSDHLLRFRRPR